MNIPWGLFQVLFEEAGPVHLQEIVIVILFQGRECLKINSQVILMFSGIHFKQITNGLG